MASTLRKLWLKHYLNSNSPGFMNASESARQAGYRCGNPGSASKIGTANKYFWAARIEKWLDDEGLSETAIKQKLFELLNKKQTLFQKVKGKVKAKDLPEYCKVVTAGESGEDEETLLAIDIEHPELQRRVVDMLMKMRGMYAAEQITLNIDDLEKKLRAADRRAEKARKER